jgi:endonuclease/exonuclease/phosphatase family metal-dependent hydrolase
VPHQDVIGLQENEATAPARLPLVALAPLLPNYSAVLRRVAWAWLVHRRTGRELLAANTHLDPFQRADLDAARLVEVAAIVELLDVIDPQRRTPAVLTGDLNIRSTGLRTAEPAPLKRRVREDLSTIGRRLSR